jgi:hypothetical protein
MSISRFAASLSAAYSLQDGLRAGTFRQILALKNVRIWLNNSAFCEICPLMGLNQHIFEIRDGDKKLRHAICMSCLKLLQEQCQDEPVLLGQIENAFKQSLECSAVIARIDEEIEADRKKRCAAVLREYEELKDEFQAMVDEFTMKEKHRERLMRKINDVLWSRMMKNQTKRSD